MPLIIDISIGIFREPFLINPIALIYYVHSVIIFLLDDFQTFIKKDYATILLFLFLVFIAKECLATKSAKLSKIFFIKDNKDRLLQIVGNDDMLCSICLREIKSCETVLEVEYIEFADDKTIIKTPCGHFYHAFCLRKWF
jgi:hypothetical protein